MAASARPGRTRRALALVALPWLLAACAAPSPAAPAPPPAAPAGASAPAPPLATAPAPTVAAPARVVVGGLGGMIDRILWVGLAKGFYREQGIDLEYVGMTSMVQAAPHLAAGQMDVMSSSTSAGLWNAIGRDVSIKIVSDVTPMRAGRRTTLSVMVRSDLAPAIRGYGDLRGRTIAIHQRAQVNHVQLGRLLELGGLTEDDVSVVEIPFPEQTVAFRNGAIDVAIAVEPLSTAMEDQGLAVRWREIGDIYPGQIVQFLFYSAPFIRERRDVGVRFLVAHLQAARYFDAAFSNGRNREEVVSILVDSGPIKDPAVYERTGPTYLTELNGRVTQESLAEEQEFYLKHGYITARLDPASMIDPSFGEDAVRILGRADE